MRTGFNEAGLGTSGPISQNTNRTSYGTGGSRSPTLSTYYGGKKSTLTESKYIKHIPCEACGSSDANSLFDDGHQYCFACETYVAGDGTTTKVSKKPMNKELKFYDSATYLSIVDRSITSTTCIAFGVKQDNGKHYYPYYNPDGSMVAIKTRSVEDKAFSVAGDFKDATLFGQNLFAKSGRYLTICEGELDALAAYQMQGSKYPCVSIRSGASGALKDCKAQYEWIDSFENIVLAFDADEPGQKAAQAVAELFGGKVKIMKHRTGYKDACDYLENNASKEFVDTWWGAESYIPDGIVQGNSLWDMVSAPIEKADCDYPYEALNKLTYGIRKGELVMVTAGSGLGKSQFLREIVWHILNKTTDNIGLMFLEEGVRKTARSLMSLAINKPIHLPDVEVSPEELKDAFDSGSYSVPTFFMYNCKENSIEPYELLHIYKVTYSDGLQLDILNKENILKTYNIITELSLNFDSDLIVKKYYELQDIYHARILELETQSNKFEEEREHVISTFNTFESYVDEYLSYYKKIALDILDIKRAEDRNLWTSHSSLTNRTSTFRLSNSPINKSLGF